MPGRRSRRQRVPQAETVQAPVAPSSDSSEIGAVPSQPLVPADAMPVGLQVKQISTPGAAVPVIGTMPSTSEDVSSEGPYLRAKRAEATQDFQLAVALYHQAIDVGDRAESAVKDVSGILHSLGRSREAVAFLMAHEHILVDRRAYQNLLQNLRQLWEVDAPETPDHMRTVQVCIKKKDSHYMPALGWQLCEKLFRNSARILCIVICGNGRQGFVEFASHSAARKAIVHCEENSSVVVRWARPEVQTSLLRETAAAQTIDTQRISSSQTGEAAANSTLTFGGPQVYHLPQSCLSVADLPVFHLLPEALWQVLHMMDWLDEEGCASNLPIANTVLVDPRQQLVCSPPPGLLPEFAALVVDADQQPVFTPPPGLPPPESPPGLAALEGPRSLPPPMGHCRWPSSWGA